MSRQNITPKPNFRSHLPEFGTLVFCKIHYFFQTLEKPFNASAWIRWINPEQLMKRSQFLLSPPTICSALREYTDKLYPRRLGENLPFNEISSALFIAFWWTNETTEIQINPNFKRRIKLKFVNKFSFPYNNDIDEHSTFNLHRFVSWTVSFEYRLRQNSVYFVLVLARLYWYTCSLCFCSFSFLIRKQFISVVFTLTNPFHLVLEKSGSTPLARVLGNKPKKKIFQKSACNLQNGLYA